MARARSTTGNRQPAAGGKRTTSVLLRGLSTELVDIFKARAERHGRSLQSELQLSLRREARRNFDEALRISEQWHTKFSGRRFLDARSMIDEDRRR